MAKSWFKSLQCKSSAYDDVYHPSFSCRNSYQNLKDVVNVDHSKPKPDPFSSRPKVRPVRPDSFSSAPKPKRKTAEQTLGSPKRAVSGPITKGPIGFGPGPIFHSVEELGKGHPSRNVVEIIFGSGWGSGGFPGRVEVVFKVKNPARSSAAFEDYRELIKLRAGSGSGARCVADGNEMMRFHCLGPATANGCDGVTSEVERTYSGSGEAHNSVSGGKGRRVMVVCRVIAGRVVNPVGLVSPAFEKGFNLGEFDSITGENDELLVFDSRAVLPCFLIIYSV